MEKRVQTHPLWAAVGAVILYPAALTGWLLLPPRAPLLAGPAGEVVVCEDFNDTLTERIVLPAQIDALCGSAAAPGSNSACVDDLDRVSGGPGRGRLLLTEAFNTQTGCAWVEQEILAAERQVRVEMDLFVSGGTNPPADGLSIVFHEGGIPTSPGREGGSLGTGGLPGRYVSVAFDLWDNGENDPESACDGASSRTCHVEVNLGSDPEVEASFASSIDVPNFAAAGNAGEVIHAIVTLNGREVTLTLESAFEGYGSREVVRTLLPPDPFGTAVPRIHAGVTATTGAANAEIAVDNLCVTTEPIQAPIVEPEPPVERGGINCGGGAVSAVIEGESLEFASDALYGAVAEVVSGTPTRYVLRSHGWLPVCDRVKAAFSDPIADLPDPSLEAVFQSEVSSHLGLLYRYNVFPGRYSITIYTAENCPCGLDRNGDPTRRYDVRIQGEDALLFFSPAEAAARAANACTGLLSTAVQRTFEADALPLEDGVAFIEVAVDDLGGGSPPLNAQLNGFSFQRIGDSTGAPLSGQIEDSRPRVPDSFSEASPLFDLDWDSIPAGSRAADALKGTATVSWRSPGPIIIQFQPLIMGGRLRLADDTRLASASSVIFDKEGAGVFDPQASRISASFDVFFYNAPGRAPADGLVFALVEGSDPRQLGAAGGSLGLAGIPVAAIGVEIDFWEGGGVGDDSGYNTDGQGHIAIVGSGGGAAQVDHVQDQNDFDPLLEGEGWVDWLSPAGHHVEVEYSPEAHVVVHLSSLDGAFPRRKVLDAMVTPFTSHEAMLGFFAATGGETATMEVDNLEVSVSTCMHPTEAARILPEGSVRLSLDGAESVTLGLNGSGSSAGGSNANGGLEYRWSVTGPEGGAELSSRCQIAALATFRIAGEYEVTLHVDDRICGTSPQATARLHIQVTETSETLFLRSDTNCDSQIDISDAVSTLSVLFLGIGALCCDDAADVNDDSTIDITDPVVTLNYLFLGGAAPVSPFPLCGPDSARTDLLECSGEPTCP